MALKFVSRRLTGLGGFEMSSLFSLCNQVAGSGAPKSNLLEIRC